MEKKVYIILTHTRTIMSKIVRFFTKYEYSHVLISLDNKFDKMYGFGRKNIYNPFYGGFVVEDMKGKMFKRFKYTKTRVYELTIKEEKYQLLKEEIEEFNQNHKIYRYDLIGLISRKLHYPIKRKNYYVCTHFVAMLLDQSGIIALKDQPEDVIPKDFEKLMELDKTNIIYEGLLNRYRPRKTYNHLYRLKKNAYI